MKQPSCYAPWINTYTWTLAPNEMAITPCCEWQPNSDYAIKTNKHMSFDERFTHPNWEKIKTDMLTKPIEQIPDCKNCVNNEQAGFYSHRKALDRLVKDWPNKTYEFDSDKFNLLHMDYRESNLCNFSCKMCGHSLSSTHAKIEGLHGKTGVLKNEQHLQEYLDNLDDVRLVEFLGGEPTLTDSMYIVINEIKKRKLEKDIEIRITTNGSVLHREQDNLIEAISGFKWIMLAVSIDCVGDQHDYWRHKGTWDKVWANTQEFYKFAKDPNNRCHMTVKTAISWPNSYAAKHVFTQFKEMDRIQIVHNIVTGPSALHLSMLPQEYLDDLVTYWEGYPNIQSIFENTKSNTNWESLAKQKQRFNVHDKWHGNSFIESFPEFENFYNSI